MLKIKKMFHSDLFWSLTGGFALGAVAMVSLQAPETDMTSYAQQASVSALEQS
ncbi:hypothetical protein [Novosphingopyxis sp.]|uniref:hypothetical protein n=1 Tax=Novosphingopyxis sp. TaxID=2709690 RepID=UPI003B5AD373